MIEICNAVTSFSTEDGHFILVVHIYILRSIWNSNMIVHSESFNFIFNLQKLSRKFMDVLLNILI